MDYRSSKRLRPLRSRRTPGISFKAKELLTISALIKYLFFAFIAGIIILAGLFLWRRRGVGGRRAGTGSCFGAHVDLGAVAQLVGAVDHDTIAGLQPRFDLDAIAVGHAEIDLADRDGAVGIDEINE